MALRCRIVSPDRTWLDAEAVLVVLPAVDGELGILPRHTPMLALLGVGSLRLQTRDGVRAFAVQEGFAEIAPDRVTVAARRVEDGAQIEPEAAAAQVRTLREKAAGAGGASGPAQAELAYARARARAARDARSPSGGAIG